MLSLRCFLLVSMLFFHQGFCRGFLGFCRDFLGFCVFFPCFVERFSRGLQRFSRFVFGFCGGCRVF